MLFCCKRHTGEVPAELCAVSVLTGLFMDGGLSCYAGCLTSVSPTTGGAPKCAPSAQEVGLCGFIAATNVQSVSPYTDWACDVSGYPATDPCAWDGIMCSGHAVVNFIVTGTVGSLPSAIGSLTDVSHLMLENSTFSGAIPTEIGCLTKLVNLVLEACTLSGPIPGTIGCLNQLTGLKLGQNSISGALPVSIGCLTELQRLGLEGNLIINPLPSSLDQLMKLKSLQLSSNYIAQAVPTSLGCLTGLQALTIASNCLTGQLPPELGCLSALTRLDLRSNKLTGPLPGALGALAALISLRLSSNSLAGMICGDLANYYYCVLHACIICFAAKPTLTLTLTPAFLLLVGTIPLAIVSMASLDKLYMDGNCLSGKFHIHCDAQRMLMRIATPTHNP